MASLPEPSITLFHISLLTYCLNKAVMVSAIMTKWLSPLLPFVEKFSWCHSLICHFSRVLIAAMLFQNKSHLALPPNNIAQWTFISSAVKQKWDWPQSQVGGESNWLMSTPRYICYTWAPFTLFIITFHSLSRYNASQYISDCHIHSFNLSDCKEACRWISAKYVTLMWHACVSWAGRNEVVVW